MVFVCAHAPHFILLYVIDSMSKLLTYRASNSLGERSEVLIVSLEFYFLFKVAFNLCLLIYTSVSCSEHVTWLKLN